MSDYARKITPICCHAYRVNRVWEEVENRWVNRLTIEPQTFCGLKEIELKTRKIQQQNQQCVTIEQFQNHGNQKLRNGPHPNRHVFVPDCLMLQVEFLAKSMPRLINT